MLQYDLTANERKTFGKGANRALRRQGFSPAVLYGGKSEPKALQLETRELTRTLIKWQKRNAVFNIDVDGSKHHVMIKEVQAKPIDNSLIHVDFYEIEIDKPMVIDVPVVFTGKAKGVELGGDLHVTRTKVTIKAKPLDVPDTIDIDVTSLDIGDSFTCGALEIPANVELLHEDDEALVTVYTASRAPQDDDEDEGDAAAEEAPEAEAAE